MRQIVLLCASMAACGGGDTPKPSEAPVESESGTAGSTAAPVETGTTSTTEPPARVVLDALADTGLEDIHGRSPFPKACSDLYADDVLQEFRLDFTPEDWAAVQSSCARGSIQYHPVTFSVGDEQIDAMARIKGNWSWTCDKMQFVVSFNEVDPDARFHGLRKVVLDAPWYDHTLLHERLAFPLFAAAGLPYSCVNNVQLRVNGDLYGVYANVERIDREYLERHFDEPDGNLYQAGVELKTNEDVADTSRQVALLSASSVAEVEALVNLDQAVAEWAMEALIPAMDNYWAGVEINYYLYDHPTQGFLYLPYDLDISFGDAAYSNGALIWPDAVHADPLWYEHPGWRKEPLVRMVLADPVWCPRFVAALEDSRAVYDPVAMAAQVDVWNAQIRPALELDPRRPFSMAQHDAAIGHLKQFLVDRAAVVDAWLAAGGHCPSE